MHFFGAERGLLATPTQCGTYAVHSTFVPWDEVLAEPERDPVLHLDHGPERRALPAGPCGPSARPSPRPRPATPPAPTARSRSTSTRADGDQSLSGLDGHHPARLLGDAGRGPLLPRGGPGASAADSGYAGHRRAGRLRLPGRHRRSAPRSPAPAPAPGPIYLPARSTSPVPTKARRSASS